jgi:hypothetical protein
MAPEKIAVFQRGIVQALQSRIRMKTTQRGTRTAFISTRSHISNKMRGGNGTNMCGLRPEKSHTKRVSPNCNGFPEIHGAGKKKKTHWDGI